MEPTNEYRPNRAVRRTGELRNQPVRRQPEAARRIPDGQNRQQSNPGKRTQVQRYTQGNVRRSDKRYSSAPVRSTAMTRVNEKSVMRSYEKELREEKIEKAWQKDIVRVKGGIDVVMLGIILLLLALGTITVFSASYPFAIAKGYESNYFIVNQVKFLLIGGVAMAAAILFPMKLYKTVVPFFMYGLSVILLILVLIIGSSEGEATRWIRFGSIGIQPSEIMKVALILILAWYCHNYEDRMKELDFGWVSIRWNTLYPFAIVCVACFFILIGKHLSGTIITAIIGGTLLLVAGCRIKWLAAAAIPVGVVGIGGFLLVNPYALKRILTFTDENADKLDELYQTTQSIFAIGNGGLFGTGIGESVQKYSYLSAAHTDFIFSVWCEETGFIGAVGLILLYLLFMWRGYLIAVRAPDRFTMLTAFGITTHVGVQALLNMCVASDMIMNTGISLPFFSYGGSSLVVLMAEMGILLAISRESYKTKKDLIREEALRKVGIES